MKKVVTFILILFTISICNYQVNAKDTLYSINKYSEENFKFIEKSYNKNNKQDGFIVAGEYLKEEKTEDYQVILEKYDFDGQKIWEFTYGKEDIDNIDFLAYTYDDSGKIDGYLISMLKPLESLENNNSIKEERTSIFIKVDLNGKKIFEKENGIDYGRINKIIPIKNENSSPDGYIAIASITKDAYINASIIKYDKDLNIVWQKDHETKENSEIHYKDIVNIYEDNNMIGYAVIEEEKSKDAVNAKLLKFDKEGNKETIEETLDKYNSYFLAESNTGFILYGLTSLVKVSGGEYSYYLIKYTKDNSIEWESIGDIAISTQENIKLLPIIKEDKIKEYLFLYQNATDNSKEVIKLDLEGLFKNKIKKISNEYYFIKDLATNGDILYFIGYITCPEEDNCNYNTHSLFLISDEDKVIEVKNNTANSMLWISIGIIAFICLIIFIRKQRN